MDFVYYIVRKRDMVILDGAKDMVNAINMAQEQNCTCLILQACFITEIGQDLDTLDSTDNIDNNLDENIEFESKDT